MRKRTKNIFFLVLSILFLYLALAYFGPIRTTTYWLNDRVTALDRKV